MVIEIPLILQMELHLSSLFASSTSLFSKTDLILPFFGYSFCFKNQIFDGISLEPIFLRTHLWNMAK